MYKLNLLTKLIGVILLQFGASTGALALDIRVSFTPEQQIKKLERAGFECGAALAAYDAPVACLRQNQIVTLNGAQILLQCVEKRACWSEPRALLASIGRKDALSPIRPVTIYEAGGRAQLFCRSQVGKNRRQVCIERWRIEARDRNIRATAWNRPATELSLGTGINGYGAAN